MGAATLTLPDAAEPWGHFVPAGQASAAPRRNSPLERLQRFEPGGAHLRDGIGS
jgi:hypothetical protein